MAKYLIVTADDMGYNTERNQGIVECFQKNAITNSSLLVNAVASAEAAQLTVQYNLPTGLHLNITEGVPVHPGTKYTTLTNEKGHFLGSAGLREAASQGKINVDEVKQEMNAQIAKYEELVGSKPAYVDGHQHAHILPELVDCFTKTLHEHGIQATRLPHEPYLSESSWIENDQWIQVFHQVNANADDARLILARYDIWYADTFFGLETMGKNMTADRLKTGIKRAFESIHTPPSNGQPITCELMTHPGYAAKGDGGCGDGPDDFSKSADREYEKQILESEEMLEFYKSHNITLVSYHKCLESL